MAGDLPRPPERAGLRLAAEPPRPPEQADRRPAAGLRQQTARAQEPPGGPAAGEPQGGSEVIQVDFYGFYVHEEKLQRTLVPRLFHLIIRFQIV